MTQRIYLLGYGYIQDGWLINLKGERVCKVRGTESLKELIVKLTAKGTYIS